MGLGTGVLVPISFEGIGYTGSFDSDGLFVRRDDQKSRLGSGPNRRVQSSRSRRTDQPLGCGYDSLAARLSDRNQKSRSSRNSRSLFFRGGYGAYPGIGKRNPIFFSGEFRILSGEKAEAEAIREKAEQKENNFLKRVGMASKTAEGEGNQTKGRTDRALEVLNRKKAGKEIVLDFSVSGKRLGKKILELKNLRKSYHRSVISGFSYTFKNGERIGIVGPNGSGKSTLLDMIVGRKKPDSGDVSIGMNTNFGYFDQVSKELSGDMRVIEYIKKECGVSVKMNDDRVLSAADMLELFLFDTRLQAGYIKNLSGGEKRRLYLVSILMANPNFLILDEPTNDFDIRTLSVLEEFLTEFEGCVLVVSHDRYFMDRTVDYLFVFRRKGSLKSFPEIIPNIWNIRII